VLEGRILEIALDGVLARVTVAIGSTTLMAVVTRESALQLGLARDDAIMASVKATAVHLC
jgi:molybdopterin-binding protein